VGDELDAGTHRVRVRGIESHGLPSGRGEPGARVALNLVGVDRHDLTRGDAITTPGQWQPVTTVDVALRVMPGAELKRRGRLTAAVGSGEHRIWFRRLDDQFARLRFDVPLPLAPGDRIVLRDSGAKATVAGAEILDITPFRKAADAPDRLHRPLGERILAEGWVPRAGLDARTGKPVDAAIALLLAAGGESVGDWIVRADAATEARARANTAVATHHRDHPMEAGLPVAEVARELHVGVPQIEALLATVNALVVEQGQVRDRSHIGRASTSDAGIEMVAALAETPLAPPAPSDLAVARALVRESVLVELDGIYFTNDALDAARTLVIDALRASGSLTIADARDVLGSTRKYVVPIMSRMDAEGVTRRRGDDRIPGPRSGLLDG
jgi:Selenocysteine-specific translation elongation factor